MKHGLILLALSGLLTGTVFARIGERLDPSNLGMADVNGRRANLPTVEMPTVTLPVIGQGTAPVSHKRIQPGRTIENKNVELGTLDFNQVETEIKPKPRANFTAKRPVDTSGRVTTGTVETPAAKISTYRIPVNSAEGQQELKRQLNRRP